MKPSAVLKQNKTFFASRLFGKIEINFRYKAFSEPNSSYFYLLLQARELSSMTGAAVLVQITNRDNGASYHLDYENGKKVDPATATQTRQRCTFESSSRHVSRPSSSQ